MAKFNPDVPQPNIPEYLRDSRPIDQIQGDRSTGVALAGIGNTISMALKAGDTVVKETIDQELYSKIDTERDAFTAGLDEQKADVTGYPTTNYSRPQGQPIDILPGSGDIPGPVEQGIRNINGIQNARMGAGDRLSETFYYGRLNAVAKSLRSEWPGYREYIDQRVAQITGGNPANDYVRSIIGEINRAQTAGKGESERVNTFLRQKDIMALPNSETMSALYNSGQRTAADIYNWAAPYIRQKSNLELYNLTHNTQKNIEEEDAGGANRALTNHAALEVSGYLGSVAVISNTNSPQKVNDFLKEVSEGKQTLSQVQSDQLVQKLTQDRIRLRAKLVADANRPNPNTGLSWAQTIKDQKVLDGIIDSQLRLIDDQIAYLKDKDISPAFFNKRFAEAKTDEVGARVLANKDVGMNMAMSGWINKNAGPAAAKDFFTSSLMNGTRMGSAWKTFVDDEKQRMMVQPDKDIRVTGDTNNIWVHGANSASGVPHTFQESVTSTQKMIETINRNAPGTVSPKIEASMYADLAEFGKKIADPTYTDATKYRLARAYFDPSNMGVISRFAKDTYDERGNRIPGQMTIFAQLTSEEVTNEIKRLSASDPSGRLWQDYKNWTETTFGRELFGPKVRELSAIKPESGVTIGYVSDPKSGTHVFTLDAMPRQPGIMDSRGPNFNAYLTRLRQDMNYVNQGIKSISNIAKAEGGDPDAYVVGLLGNYGYRPHGSTLPDQMIKAVIQSRTPTEGSGANDPFKTKTKDKTSERLPAGAPYGYVTPDAPLMIGP